MEIFSKRLADSMESANLTIYTIGQKTGIFPQMIKSYLDGEAEPRFIILRAICLTLNVSSDYLLGLTDKKDC